MARVTAAVAMMWQHAAILAVLLHSASGTGIQLPRSQDVRVNKVTVNAAFTILEQHYKDKFQITHEDKGRRVGKLTLHGRVFTISSAYSTAYIMIQGPRTMLEQVQGELTGLVGGTCYTRRDAASDPQMAPDEACPAEPGAEAGASTQSRASASSGNQSDGPEESATEEQPQGEQHAVDMVINGIRRILVSSRRRRRSPRTRSRT